MPSGQQFWLLKQWLQPKGTKAAAMPSNAPACYPDATQDNSPDRKYLDKPLKSLVPGEGFEPPTF